MKKERVQKLLAQAGVASRRKSEEYIQQGRVSVNGHQVGLGATAAPSDEIRVDGQKIQSEKLVYILLHKPKGVTSTCADPHAQKTVLDLVKVPLRIFPVGRLDRDSEGLLLLTNDGNLAQRLTHPQFGVEKTYLVFTEKALAAQELSLLKKDLVVEGRHVVLHQLHLLSPTLLRLTIHEGRKHIVRQLMAAIGHKIKRLVRIQMGPLALGNLPLSKWRRLSPREVYLLKETAKSHQSH